MSRQNPKSSEQNEIYIVLTWVDCLLSNATSY
jgi:hypothetical protein